MKKHLLTAIGRPSWRGFTIRALILLTTLVILSVVEVQAQVPKEELIFDAATMAADTMTVREKMGRNYHHSEIDVQYRFEDFDCTDNFFDVGAGLVDNAPCYPATAGEIEFPVALDTTATRPAPNTAQLLFSRYPYQASRQWTFKVQFKWNSYYLFETFYKGSCTSGKIYRIK